MSDSSFIKSHTISVNLIAIFGSKNFTRFSIYFTVSSTFLPLLIYIILHENSLFVSTTYLSFSFSTSVSENLVLELIDHEYDGLSTHQTTLFING